MKTRITGAEFIALYLQKQKISHVLEVIGGMIALIIDAMYRKTGIKIISMHHEQAAGFAAEGFSRFTNRPSVAMATSGPGATNLATAIGSCYFDSVPVLFLTGQVNRNEQKKRKKIRQLGFQETDIVSVTKPICKKSYMVQSARHLQALLPHTFEIMAEGRKGPVVLDVPMDIQKNLYYFSLKKKNADPGISPQHERSFFTYLQHSLEGARKPLILLGGGIRSSGTEKQADKLVQRFGIPAVHSLMAVDVLPFLNPLRVGLIGSYGNRWANLALAESDLLLVLGSRLDIRQTGANAKSFSRGKKIFHVDTERGEMNNRIKGCLTFQSELPFFFEKLLKKKGFKNKKWSEWTKKIHFLKKQWPDTKENKNSDRVNPNRFMIALSERSKKASGFVVDVGQHQMWAAQSLRLFAGQRFITSGGMGSMGFALPASIGACLAVTPCPIVMIAGDGGFQCNLQELQTVKRNNLAIKMVVINNGCHGMVRQFQESYLEKRYQSTLLGYSAPSFAKIARAYGIKATKVVREKDVELKLRMMWEKPREPFLLEVVLSSDVNVYPKLAFGKTLADMEPQVFSEKLEST